MPTLEHWHLWAILGIILLIMEMFTFTFYLASFGVGAFGSSIAAASDATVTWQVAVFAIVTAVCLSLLRPLFRNLYKRSDDRPTNVGAMMGLVGFVADEVGDDLTPGRVKVGGEEWRAVSADGARLPVGARVQITAVQGATLTVRPV